MLALASTTLLSFSCRLYATMTHSWYKHISAGKLTTHISIKEVSNSLFSGVIFGSTNRARQRHHAYFRSGREAWWDMQCVRGSYKYMGTSFIGLFTARAWARQVRIAASCYNTTQTHSIWPCKCTSVTSERGEKMIIWAIVYLSL